jgi:hypothetical protein
MTLHVSPMYVCVVAGIAIFCLGMSSTAQVSGSNSGLVALAADTGLPDAPQSQTLASDRAESSSLMSQATPDAPQKTQEQIAEEQLKQEKKQRALGFLPSFNTSYNDNAVSLTAKQKFKLAFTSSTDPVQFGVAGVVALIGQAEGSDYGYGGGIGGYGKRFGADYADSFDGAMIGNALLPSILHQDPRYFRRGYGSKTQRMLYAISTTVICRHDVTGKREPNYSNVLGNVAAGGISNLYVPENERGVWNTFEGAILVTGEGGVGSILQEFWPDLSRRFLHKDPTNGQDAINRLKHQ